MAESVGMQIIHQRFQDIILAMKIHAFTLMDLKRLEVMSQQIANKCKESIILIQEDLAKTEGGDGGL